MGWVEDLRSLLPRLPREFTLRDVYLFVPYFQERYPENRFVKEKLRQTLQILRDDGDLEFVEPGFYRKHAETVQLDDWPFQVGDRVSRADLASYFQQAGPAGLGRGMFKPARGKPHDSHMVLFHDEADNPYGDVVEDARIIYVGEGRAELGNQQLMGNNATLAKHLELGVHVHYFTQLKDEPGKSRYDGEMVVENWRTVFRPSENRTVIEYVLIPAGSRDATVDYSRLFRAMTHPPPEPALEERRRVMRTYEQIVRSKVFSDQVIAAYEEHCAVCGKPLRVGTFHELDAAHIVAVASRGRDEVRNGLSLCKRHHWAFDHGVFTLKDDHTISWLLHEADPHGEALHGAKIRLPENKMDWPHPFYLALHRKSWQ